MADAMLPLLEPAALHAWARSALAASARSARRRARLVAVLAIACGVAFAGCPGGSGQRPIGTTPSLTTDDPDAEADLRTAERAAEEGRASDAAQAYRAFLDEHPADALVPIAELGLGRVLLASGDAAGALDHFDRAATSDDEVVAERARFHRGVSLHLLGRHAESIEVLSPLRGRLVDPSDTALLLRTLAAGSTATGDPIAALDALDDLVRAQTSEADTAEARARIDAIVESELPAEQVARAYETLDRDGTAWPQVALRAIRAAYDAGDVERVRAIAGELRSRGVELSEELAALVLRADRIATADPRVIGAILPLSGRGREIGQRALRGLMLAAGTPAEGPPPPDAPQLVLRDDAGDPERAARAVEELVSTHRAIAIIGPLDGPSAVAAARRAQQLGVPLITLSPADDVTRAGPMAFRLFPSAEGELRALVRAARARGAARFATLHPESAYGRAMRDALARAVAAEGGEIAGSAAYAAGATSFAPQVQQIVASGADAVLVADSGRSLALIAPALAAAGLWSTVPGTAAPSRGRAIALMVPSVGFDPRLARTTGRYLQGAIFSVPFHAPTAEGEARTFTNDFMTRFGAEPDAFAAYAYDAFGLVQRAVASGETSRAGVASWLAAGNVTPTAGASGGLDATRSARGATRILVLRGEIFEAQGN